MFCLLYGPIYSDTILNTQYDDKNWRFNSEKQFSDQNGRRWNQVQNTTYLAPCKKDFKMFTGIDLFCLFVQLYKPWIGGHFENNNNKKGGKCHVTPIDGHP